MFDRLRFAWRAWSMYDQVVEAWRGGRMNYGVLINLVLSGLGVGFATFVTASETGATTKAALSAAATAAIAAVMQHLRGSPLETAPAPQSKPAA